ncbi:hypothetical protein MPDQ_007822 [Monascus purpureus]|uniref:Uncharacterized protein n=1 Tax=Monascus purpureus TaxID=5098 RepID=A0A507QVF7_MONPU|nr:hypothetical protein MPDQ_007822 [Monascus purpureus]
MADIGISFSAIKSLLIFFAPVLIPRAINLLRSLRTAITQRPSPLPSITSRALNVLFSTTLFFLLLSLPFNPRAPPPNIFSLTRSRLNTPTDIIFTRLARLRPGGTLTPADDLLRSKFTSLGARKLYLRFGADALTSCQFCSLDNTSTYLLYYLPYNTLLPHLFHLLILGLVTSAPFAGQEAARWRTKFTVAGLVVAAVDFYIAVRYDPVQSAPVAVRAGQLPPSSLYNQVALLRPLAFAIFDCVCAALIYMSATNRLSFSPPTLQREQVDQLIAATTSSLRDTSAKLHALNVTRNAVVRDKALKDRDDVYWRAVVSADGDPAKIMAPASVWDEEDVVRAISRVMAGHGGVDLEKLNSTVGDYVNGVTAGLENADDEKRP